MGIIGRKGIRAAYEKEAESLITRLEKGLEGFKTGKQGASIKARLFRLFVYAHTLKGISGTCGYTEIEEAAGVITEIFRAARDGAGISLENMASFSKNVEMCKKSLKDIAGYHEKK